jgi:hypothetical protein
MTMNFKNWLISEKKDLFGFEREKERKAKPPMDENPIGPIAGDALMAELARHDVGTKKSIRNWYDHIQWGDGNTGSLRAYISPIGSYTVRIKRKVEDLEGNAVWICKKAIQLKDRPGTLTEISQANDLTQELDRVDKEQIEMPSKDFKDFKRLVEKLASQCRSASPEIFMYEGVKKMSDEYYIIHFMVSGQGVEAPTARRVEAFHINVQYEREKGLIRCWGNDISSPTNQHEWQSRPAEWDEVFCPAQPMKEIVDSITVLLKAY